MRQVALFGGIGAIAGLKEKKSKEYLVAIQWKDSEKSLICIDDECYKTLVKCMFYGIEKTPRLWGVLFTTIVHFFIYSITQFLYIICNGY